MLPKPILKHIALYCLLLCSFLPYLTNTQPLEIAENRPKATFPAALSSRHFSIALDYPKAFELVITAFNGNTTARGFCDPFPARINHKVQWSGRINTTSDEPDQTGELENHSYDNIVVFNNYYFILESSSFNIIAIKDFHDRSTYYTIESEFQNHDSEEQLEDTWMVVDPNEKFLYIITRKVFLTYNLVDFFNALKNNKPVPKLKTQDPNYPGYDMITSIKYYKHRLYIVADNVAQVHVVTKGGQITPQIKFDHNFFETDTVAISDVAFRGNYIYVLDTLKGVYIVDITRADIPDNNNVTTKYVFRPDDTTEVLKGKFIAIIGDSLHVVTSGAKSQYLFEYIIRGDQTFLDLEFNRKYELFQAVRESYADSNYLYLVTGFFNMVAKHSIPGRFFSPAVENFLLEYWPTMEAKTLVSQVEGEVSTVVILHEDMATVMVFDEANPVISCRTQGVKEGFYTYKLRAVQNDCPALRNTTGADYNTVCEITQEIQLMMVDDRIIGIEQVEESKKKETYLYVGIGVLAVLVVIFLCLVRKYKNQYKRLEDRIKFHKLDNESVDQKSQRKQDQGDSQDINPYNINIQAELKKDEQKKKSPSPTKASPTKSPNKSPNKKPNTEFGDLKPLDVDEIYGRKGKGKQDDDSY